jgi:hypothetical protein
VIYDVLPLFPGTTFCAVNDGAGLPLEHLLFDLLVGRASFDDDDVGGENGHFEAV